MPLIIGLGVAGGAANAYSQQQQYEQQKKIAAATQRYSPWTGMHAQTPTQPGYLGSFMQGGMQGAAMGQGIGNAAQSNQLAQAQANWYNNPSNSGMGAMPASPLANGFWANNPYGG